VRRDTEPTTALKLIIQIPCLNEAEHIGITLSELPRTIEGISSIEYLVIDDGSTDGTAETAHDAGAHHVVRLSMNRGLAAAFQTGLQAALDRGADVIVNTDADNQYNAADIARLVRPIAERRADLVIGIRPIDEIEHFSWPKKRLQAIGSLVVRSVSGTDVRDAASGFRAFSREAAILINLTTRYSHTLETLIQAGNSGLRIVQVPIRVNALRRGSRLFGSTAGYVARSALDIIRIYLHYRGHRFFLWLGLLLMAPGVLLGLRYVYFYLEGHGGGYVQSLILSAILIIMGFQSWLMAILVSSQKGSRILIERLVAENKKLTGKDRPDRVGRPAP
jgi:glycosyltransferase involved in cell wall biosynthesis